MDGRLWVNGHLKEEILEEYAFGRLNDQDVAAVEEHYLACHHCQDSLEAVEQEIRTVRTAFASAALHPPVGKLSIWDRFGSRLRDAWVERQSMVVAVGLAVICVAAVAVYGFRSGLQPVVPSTVLLASYRGGDPSQMAQAPAGRPLDLRIDSVGIPSPERCRVELVNATGDVQWNGGLTLVGSQLQASVPERLRAGQYWVRIYASDNSLLREFGLHVG